MNQISALPNPLEILFQEYNQGRIESVGFRSFTLSLPSEDYSCTDVPTRP